jgi:hypothetical protein
MRHVVSSLEKQLADRFETRDSKNKSYFLDQFDKIKESFILSPKSWMKLEAAELVAYHALELFHHGVEATTTIGVYCNSAKYLAAEVAFRACERAMLTLGGMGYTRISHLKKVSLIVGLSR